MAFDAGAAVDPTKVFRKDEEVMMEGFLEKRGEWNKAWKSRYFVLESCGKLTYYEAPGDKGIPEKAKGSIPISTGMTVKEGESAEGREVIELIVPGTMMTRTFTIGAPSKEVQAEWIKNLTKLQKRVHYVTFQENVRHW